MLSEQAQHAAQQAVCSRLLAFEPYKRAGCVMAYAAVRGELSLAPVLEDVIASGKALLMPRCESPGVMTARRIRRIDDLEDGMMGLLEPHKDTEIADPKEIDLILVPGTAFDRAGNRIGQGGGYYDRFLERTNALRVGVCHDFALLERVAHEAHDAQMDFIAAPCGIICTGGIRQENT